MKPTKITQTLKPNQERLDFLSTHLGTKCVEIENLIYAIMTKASADYSGGFWNFFELSNGGFFIAPDRTQQINGDRPAPARRRREEDALALLRSRLFDVFTLFWSLVFVPPIVTLFQIRRDPDLVRRFSRTWARGMLWGMRRIAGLRHEVPAPAGRGRRPALLVANHQSLWETIAFTVIEPDVSIVAKRALTRIPFFGWYLQRYPMIFIDRDKPGANARRLVQEARQALDEGRSVLIFPEGTRVLPAERRAYEAGLKLLIKALQCEVVPIAHNSGAFVDDRRNLKRPGVVEVTYLPARSAPHDVAAVAAEVETAIDAEKTRLLAALRRRDDASAER